MTRFAVVFLSVLAILPVGNASPTHGNWDHDFKLESYRDRKPHWRSWGCFVPWGNHTACHKPTATAISTILPTTTTVITNTTSFTTETSTLATSPTVSVHTTSTSTSSTVGATTTDSSATTSLSATVSTSTSPSVSTSTSSTTTKASTSTSTSKPTTSTRAPTTTPSSTSTISASGPTGTGTSSADISTYLTQHNKIRQLHGAVDLQWNETLAEAASRWSSGCTMQHSNGTLGPFGENLAAGAGGGYNLVSAVTSWTNESSSYNPKNPQPSHFTQVVWKSTTQLGCASQLCDGIFPPEYGKATFVVCEYFPPGNVAGGYAANVQA